MRGVLIAPRAHGRPTYVHFRGHGGDPRASACKWGFPKIGGPNIAP